MSDTMYTYIEVEVEYPVPSCACYRIIFKDNKWYYIYRFRCPKKSKLVNGLYVYGHILQLNLTDKVSVNSINIKVSSIDELRNLLYLQKEEDNKFRESWIKENPDYYDKCSYTSFKNKDNFIKENMNIIKLVKQDEDESKFIIASNKYKKEIREEEA